MKVLILTGKFGMGHTSAAEALREEIEEEPEVFVTTVDILFYLLPTAAGLIYKVFNNMSGRFRRLYNLANRLDERHTIAPMRRWFFRKFEGLLAEEEPDVVISTLPVAAKYMGAYREKSEGEICFITCITDILPHNQWISDGTSAYMVGDEMTRRMLMEKGVPPEKIFVGGIPVKKAFREETTEPHVSRCGEKEVLVMGGGLGLIPGAEGIVGELRKIPGVHVTVIAGNNTELRGKLEARYSDIEVTGYTGRVAEYMRRADLLVSKAGGVTLFEAIYSGTPMLALHPFPEQEKTNAQMLEEEDIGVVMDRKRWRYGKQIREILTDEAGLEGMRENMRRIRESCDANSITGIIRSMRDRREEMR